MCTAMWARLARVSPVLLVLVCLRCVWIRRCGQGLRLSSRVSGARVYGGRHSRCADSPVRIWWSMSLFAGFPQVQSWIDGCDLTVAARCRSASVCRSEVPQVRSVRRQSRFHCCCFTPDLQYIDKGGRCPGCRSHACCCPTTGAVMVDGSFLGQCNTGTRPGAPPTNQGGGRGGGDAGELAPRCSATQLGALSARAWTDSPCR